MRGLILMLGVVLLGASPGARAAAETDSADAAAAAKTGSAEAPPPTESGLVIYVDPKTGRRTAVPTEEQRRAFLDQVEAERDSLRELPDLKEIPLRNGGVMVHTEGRVQAMVIVTPGADGKLHYECDNPMHRHGGTPGEHVEATDEPAER